MRNCEICFLGEFGDMLLPKGFSPTVVKFLHEKFILKMYTVTNNAFGLREPELNEPE